MPMRRIATWTAVSAVALAVGALPAAAQKKGGDVVALLYAGLNSIDPHFTTTYPARTMLLGIYETLVTVDETGSTIPMLAESVEVAPDGLTYRFPLRKGVKFHNGKEMTSADVKASLERFAKLSPARVSMEIVSAIETPDANTVVVKLKNPSSTWLDRLAAPTSPASIIPIEEAAKELNKTNSISTGPFAFVEWIPDQHFRIKRFDGYAPNRSKPERTGFGGPKAAHLDTVTFRVVSEASARVFALEAGQVHFIEDIPGPAAQRLATNPKIQLLDLPTFQMPVLYLNHAIAPTNDLNVRKAIQAALDMEEVMGAAASGSPYVIQHAWTFRGHPLYSEAGKELYNQKNIEKAKQLLKASSYKGEEFIYNIGNIGFMTRLSVIAAQTLKEIGLNVKTATYDLGTLFSISGKDENWHITTSGYGSQPFLGPYMYQAIMIGPANLSRRKGDTVMEGFWQEFDKATNDAQRKGPWEKIQKHTYDEVYYIKLGDLGMKYAAAANLKGFKAYPGALRFWDTWLD